MENKEGIPGTHYLSPGFAPRGVISRNFGDGGCFGWPDGRLAQGGALGGKA